MVPALSVAIMFALRATFDLAPGVVAGIFAGSNTATPGLGAAQTAYASAGDMLRGEPVSVVLANMSTAFAFAYCISTVLFVVVVKLPDMLGRDTPEAASQLEAQLRGDSSAPLPGSAEEFIRSGPARVGVRSFTLENPDAVGQAPRRTTPHVSAGRDRADPAGATSCSNRSTTWCCRPTTRWHFTAPCRGSCARAPASVRKSRPRCRRSWVSRRSISSCTAAAWRASPSSNSRAGSDTD